MQREDMWQDQPATRAKPNHLMAALFALFVSVVLHVLFLEKLPGFTMGIAQPIQDAIHYPAIQLQEVRHVQEQAPERTRRVRMENPEQVAELLGEPDLSRPESPPQSLPSPDTPDYAARSMQDNQPALAPPVSGKRPEYWEPRQDIIQIEKRIYADAISALPRRYADSVARVVRAPDIVLPMDHIDNMEPSRLNAESSTSGGGSTHTFFRDQPNIGFPQGQGGEGAGASDSIFPKESVKWNETIRTTNDIQSIEQYLALDVQVFRPDDERNVTYFEMHISRHGTDTLPVLPKDVLLMQDCSESMTPWKLSECKRGLRHCLELLGPDDRFDVMAFSDEPRSLFGSWQKLNAATRANAVEFIDDMRARGNTDVYASLHAASGLGRDSNRPFLAIVITDGRPTMGVTDSSDIIERFTVENEGRISVFTVAGGKRINRFLVDLVSYRNRGDSLVVEDAEQMAAAEEQIAKELNRPVLMDLSYRFTGINDEDIFPKRLTHLFLDRPLVIYGRLEQKADNAAVQIVGRSGEKVKDMVFKLDIDHATTGDESIRKQWAWHKVYDLMADYIRTRDDRYIKELQKIVQQHGLIIPFWIGSTANEVLPR